MKKTDNERFSKPIILLSSIKFYLKFDGEYPNMEAKKKLEIIRATIFIFYAFLFAYRVIAR